MIIATGASESEWRNGFVVCIPAPVALETMCNRAAVKPGSYAARLVTSLYEEVFQRSLDLLADYQRFFAVEYPTFNEYLQKRHTFDQGVVTELTRLARQGGLMLYCVPGWTFLEDSDGGELLSALLEPTEPQ